MATFLDSYQDDDADEEFNEIQYGGKELCLCLNFRFMFYVFDIT